MCGCQPGDRPGQVLAHAVGVADVEVQPDRRGVRSARRPPGTGRSSRSAGPAPARSGAGRRPSWACSASGLRTSTNRSSAAWRDWPGASGPPGSVVMCGAPSSAQSAERASGVVDADLAVVRIGLDPRRMPVRLALVGDRVHHEGVDVRELQPESLQRRRDRPLLPVEQAGRPGVGHVGHELEARVADAARSARRPRRRSISDRRWC